MAVFSCMRAGAILGIASLVMFAVDARAQTSGNVQFDGLILDVCVLLITGSGTIAPNATYTQLSSEIGGGSRGGATVTTTSTNFNLVVDTPTGFSSMPAGGDANVTYSALFSATGVTILNDVLEGVLSPLGLGLSTVSVGVTADKSAGVFPAGAYQLPVTVRCESS
ncbi:hypothetical protein PUV54_07215 [Hyphococcus flavus]|uniref:DUF4402 domain-containing protein n=1 Tax=Hyphococcus flavus TaxID=1866326 RepID=A0AAE9ZLM9_9PROT|nr:hypothetical protein [Hyphococcus flavus]WDI32985.1 hypothetical protein PUV54_07215 [Hyphococcus flavus]